MNGVNNMSTPERKSGQTSWSRRQPQQQQQHNSPFRRARREPLHLDASHGLLSPPREPSTRHRRNFSQTGTLRGAFEFASRLPLSENEEDLFLYERMRKPSPRKRRQSNSAMLPSNSNPPDELAEAYRQINDATSLTDADIDPSDDEDAVYMSNREELYRQLSPERRRWEGRPSVTSDTSFTGDPPRRRSVDYTRDEERLRRATTSPAPVLDRSAIGAGPSSEHLQRREEETEEEEEDYGIEPSMKAPSNWGSRGRYKQGWMKTLTRSHERGAESTGEPGESASRLWDEISSSLSAQRAAEKRAAQRRETTEERRGSQRSGVPSADPQQSSPKRKEENMFEGERIPNTPVVVFPGSTFNKRSPSKRDSHDLLRKLARTGSPRQSQPSDATQTPEPTTTERRIYDKTPVVTGAWIDTPMTQRDPASRINEVAKASRARSDKVWGLGKLIEEAGHKEEKTPNTEDLLPNFEPMKEKMKEEKPAEDQVKTSTLTELLSKKKGKEKGEEKQPERPIADIFTGRAQTTGKDWQPLTMPMPDHPKSALETVLQEHKTNKGALDVGDDTIESLQELVDQQPSDGAKANEEDYTAYEEQVIGKLESARSSDDQKGQEKDDGAYKHQVVGEPDSVLTGQSSEMNDFERFEGKLQAFSEHFAEMKSGFNQLVRHVELIISLLTQNPTESTGSRPVQSQGGCETCRAREHKAAQGTIPLPRLWDQSESWKRLHPTRLGWAIIIALAWYFAESTMCDYYCHPFVGSRCEGNCLLPDAPRFPFVIPTMAWRWLHFSDILLPIWAVIVAFFRLFAQLLGLSDGYVDDEPSPLDLSGKVRIQGTQIDHATIHATSRSSIPLVSQWRWKKETHIPDSVPEVNLETSSDGDHWADASMDDDEFL